MSESLTHSTPQPRVLPELRDLLPPLSAEEAAQLEANLLADGCRDALVVWDGVLVDGHNRLRICQEHKIPFETREREFDNLAHVKAWMIDAQAGRRNLTPAWRIELALQRKALLLEEGRAKQAETLGGFKHHASSVVSPGDTTEPTRRTRDEIAKAANVSTGMVGMAERVREAAPDLWEKAKGGEVSVKTAYQTLRKEEKARDKEERRAAKLTAKNAPVNTPREQLYQLHNCGIETLHDSIPANTADWIITDPPYPREYLPVYEHLATFAAHALKPGGSLICMVGQSYLPEILTALTKHLTYHWTVAYLTPGGQATQLWQKNVNTFWKPLLWLTNGQYEGDWIGDVTKSDPNHNDKTRHHWGQSESGMADIIERFTYPGETIIDPFVGGGTTGTVAVAMNRRFIGADNDPQAIETTRARLADA